MGGLVTRVLSLCGTKFQDCAFKYRVNANFDMGDVRRLITIGTPHQGTPLAVDLWTHRGTGCGPGGFWGTLAENFAKADTPLGGALEDLQTGSGALTGLNGSTTAFPMAFFVGFASTNDESSFNSGLIDIVRSCNSSIVPASVRTVFGEDSDLVVSVTSQRYGLSDAALGTQKYTPTIHSSALTKGKAGFSSDELSFTTLSSAVVTALDTGVFVTK